jgi:hypothetical protein
VIYLKCESGLQERFYFTDGKSKVSESFTFKGTIAKLNFLHSVGVEVDTTFTEIAWDCYFK